jgi:predicted RNA-binding protein with PIN domain
MRDRSDHTRGHHAGPFDTLRPARRQGIRHHPSVSEIVVVDGFNVLHAAVLRGRDRAGWRGAEARERLLDAVRAAAVPDGAEVVVVFDDRSPAPEPGPGPTVVHAPDADEWIVARVAEDPRPQRILVATADRSLGDRARARGARLIRPHALLAGRAGAQAG